VELWQKVIAGLIVVFIGTLSTYLWRFFKKKTDARITFECKLIFNTEIGILERIGCPILEVIIKSTGDTAAKIKRARICVTGRDFLSAFQKGFGDLGYTPTSEQKEQTLYIDLIPLTKPNSEQSYVLEKNDVCKWALP